MSRTPDQVLDELLAISPQGDTMPVSHDTVYAHMLAHSRWTGKTGVRPADFIALAASRGVSITIREYAVLEAGFFAGAEVVNSPTQFDWLVTLPATIAVYAEAGSMRAGDLVSSFEASLAQPAIAGHAPAHTTPIFSYTG